jgi:hypothetical protein
MTCFNQIKLELLQTEGEGIPKDVKNYQKINSSHLFQLTSSDTNSIIGTVFFNFASAKKL